MTSEWLTEALPGLLVLLYALLQVRYWLVVYKLKQEVACCRARIRELQGERAREGPCIA